MSKILVVDDNNNSLYLLKKLFKNHGHEVVTASNGAEALEKARQDPPDMIISDIIMPVMNGFSLCREWKADARLNKAPFVFYSATFTDSRDEKLGLALGASRFICKPIEPGEFINIITNVLKEYEEGKLKVPDTSPNDEDVGNIYADVLTRKLDRKVEELHKEHDALNRSEQRYSRLVETTKSIPWNMDIASRKFTYMGQQVERITGYPADMWKDFHFWKERIHPEDREETVAGCLDAIKHGEDREIEYRMVNAEGGVIWIKDMISAGKRDDTPVELIGVMFDITEQKELERQSLQSQKMEALAQLTGGMAHDFNNIFSAIIGYTQLLELKIKEDGPSKKLVEQILGSSVRAANLVRSLLAFSRKQSLSFKNENLGKVIKRTEDFLAGEIGKEIELRVVLRPPFDRESINVSIDTGQIEQVLINLAANARDAMPNGGVLTIEMGSAEVDESFIKAHGFGRSGTYAEITVSDTGAGMDKKTMDRIFEPFFTTRPKGRGSGLGLAMVYGIIDQHNGYINVESEINRGTVFRIYLSLVKTKRNELFRETGKDNAISKTGIETVLVAEDDDALRCMLRTVLNKHGYHVVEALDGQEAIDKFIENKENIHLIVSDLLMPKKNGNEVFTEIQKIKPDIKAIILSGQDDNMMRSNIIPRKEVSLMQKPVYPKDLLLKIREVLEQ